MLLNQDLAELREGVRSFLGETCGRDHIRRSLESGPSSLLSRLRDFGVFAMLSELNGSGIEAIVMVAEEAGYALLPDRISSFLLGGPWLVSALEREFSTPLQEKVRSGEVILAPALHESVTCTSDFQRGEVLTGEVNFVLASEEVSYLVIRDQDDYLCVVSTEDEGVSLNLAPSLDPLLPVGVLCLNGAKPMLRCLERDLMTKLRLADSLLAQAEALGAARRAIDMTVEHCRTREQFGVSVGGFQAIQQGLAHHYSAIESFRALTRFSARSIEIDFVQAEISVLAGLAKAHHSCAAAVEVCIQYHGGIGFAWEHDLHLLLRRVMLLLGAHPWGEREARVLVQLSAAQ